MTPALDAAQGLTDLPDFRAGYVVKSLQHVIILYLAGTLLPVTVTRRPEIPLDRPDSPHESIEPFLQLHSHSVVLGHVALLNRVRSSTQIASGRSRAEGVLLDALKQSRQRASVERIALQPAHPASLFVLSADDPHRHAFEIGNTRHVGSENGTSNGSRGHWCTPFILATSLRFRVVLTQGRRLHA